MSMNLMEENNGLADLRQHVYKLEKEVQLLMEYTEHVHNGYDAPRIKMENVDTIISGNVTLKDQFDLKLQGWGHDMAFTATDHDTVAWASGTITLLDGTSHSITGANTGTMSAITYIYLDTDVSETVLQTTTTASTAIGSSKILIAVAEDVASGNLATFQVFGGKALGGLGKLITADDIVANTITANEIYANTITASELTTGAFVTATANITDGIITNAKIANLAVSKLTAGSIASKAITLAISAGDGDSYIAAGKTDFTNTQAGFILGLDDSDSDLAKFYIGNASAYLNWTGSALNIKGGITIDSGSGIANLSDAGDLATTNEADANVLNMTNAPSEAGADVTGNNTAANITSQGNLATANTVGNGEITDVAVSKLTAGSITSKAITLAVVAGTGDSYIAGGNNIDIANWRGGDGTGGAIILGIDDSDSDKGKFFAGNYSTNQYASFDGDDFIVNGSPIANNLFYGNGADGNATIAVSDTLTQDKYYDSLTINAGVILNTGGYRIFVKNTLTNNGTISRDGNAGGNGGNGGNGADSGFATGGTAGTAGAALADGNLPDSTAGLAGKAGANSQSAGSMALNGIAGTNGSNGGNVIHSLGSDGKNMSVQGDGGDGGLGAGNATGGIGGNGGTGGTGTFATDKPYRLPMAIDLLDWGANTTPDKTTTSAQSGGSASGGSGGARGNNAFIRACGGAGGGSGGNGGDGGMVVIASRHMVNNGTISALGGNAGNGGTGGTGYAPSGAVGAGGGGGGAAGCSGSGGVVILIYSSLSNSGTISVAVGSAGSYGAGGAHGATGGTNGLDGAPGTTGNTGTLVYLQN